MVTRKRLYSENCHFLALAGILYKYDQFHTTLGGLSSVCAKVEPTSSKNNEILEINALQKGPVKLIKRVKIAHNSFLQPVSDQFHVIILSLPT